MLVVTKLVPKEPSAWANLGLFALRCGAFDLAAERLQQARTMAPDNSEIQMLSRLLQRMPGEFLRLPSPRSYLASPDTALTFTTEPLPTVAGSWAWIEAVVFNSEDAPHVIVADAHQMRADNGMTLKFPR